jgi:N-acetylneuraminic acid mutarotase
MKNYLLTTFVCILIMLPNLAHAQACRISYGVYSELTAMPVKSASMASGVIDGKIYLAGGYDFNPNNEVVMKDHLSVYDPETDTWDTSRAPIPVTRYIFGAMNSVLDGKLYVIGGLNWIWVEDSWQAAPNARVDVYDPQSDVWELKANLPIPLGGNGVCTMNGKLYVSGGLSTDMIPLSSFYSYDVEDDKWTELTDMTTPRAYHVSVALDGKIYVISGTEDETGYDASGTISGEVYNPDSNQWTSISPLPRDNIFNAACVVDGEIYVFGGAEHMSHWAYGYVNKYIPEKDTWIEIDQMPLNKRDHNTVPIGRTIYMMGGRTAGTVVNGLVHAYELSDVRLDSFIPDTTIYGSEFEVDLSVYFSHVDGGDIQYTVCHDDTNVITTEINGNKLTITGLSSGEAEVSILAESGEDQMGDVFQVTFAPASGIDERGGFTASLTIYPNPARGMTTLEYSVQSPGIVRLEVYDLTGKRVAALLNEYRVPGEYEYLLNTGGFEPGIYFCDLTSATGRATVKLIIE